MCTIDISILRAHSPKSEPHKNENFDLMPSNLFLLMPLLRDSKSILFANNQQREMLKQHQSQAILALVFCCLSANLLLNYAQQNVLQGEQQAAKDAATLDKVQAPPKLVWLMSFPNSGTSYTLRQMERLSNYSMATNYGSEGERTAPVFEDQPHGPRCRGPSDNWPHPMPKDYILVKTHCTGYATNEGASALKRNRKEFVEGCATTKPNEPNAIKGKYDTSLVHKAVHVIRNPFHNIISRFNCEHKLSAQEGGDRARNFAEKYPKSAHGFHNFCRDLDADFDKQYSKDIIPETERHLVKHTRCHDDVISYVQWHNHAFETCRELHLPTLVVYYEDYEDDFNMTFSNLMDFMHLEENGQANGFTARHDYQDYFTSEDRQNIKHLVKQLASNHTWRALARYFD